MFKLGNKVTVIEFLEAMEIVNDEYEFDNIKMKCKLIDDPEGFEINIFHDDEEILNRVLLTSTKANSRLKFPKKYEKIISEKIKDIHKNKDKYEQMMDLKKIKEIMGNVNNR